MSHTKNSLHASTKGLSALATVEHPLATKQGLELMIGLLFHTGAMCPKCSFGTRVTSKRWATCKKCGERVERRPMPTVNANSNPTKGD